MNSVLIYKASDIFIFQAIVNELHSHNIETFGSDAQINPIYPNTPNLYLAGASAIFEGYRILVLEKDYEKSNELIQNLLSRIESNNIDQKNQNKILSDSKIESSSVDYLRQFNFMGLCSIFIPVLPPIFSIYFAFKAKSIGQKFSFWKTLFIFILIIFNIIASASLISLNIIDSN